MPSRSPARDRQAILWELRAAWASRKVVVLSLSPRCVVRRVEGTVDRVAATGAYVIADGWHIPEEDILAVHKPHFAQKADG